MRNVFAATLILSLFLLTSGQDIYNRPPNSNRDSTRAEGTVFTIFLFSSSNCNFAFSEGPRIITAPKNQIVVNERVANFICEAIGSPKPQIEWRKNGKRLVTLRYTVLEIPNGSVLRIEPVRPGRDNATYECLAENGIGEPVREQADLHVLSGQFLSDFFLFFLFS